MNIRRGVLWDSSAILALLDAHDADHERAVAIARQIPSERLPSFIMNYIEVEAHALLLRKLGPALAREWLLTGGLRTRGRGGSGQGEDRAALRQNRDFGLPR